MQLHVFGPVCRPSSGCLENLSDSTLRVVPFCEGGRDLALQQFLLISTIHVVRRDLVPLHKKVPLALYSNLSSLSNLMMAHTHTAETCSCIVYIATNYIYIYCCVL